MCAPSPEPSLYRRDRIDHRYTMLECAATSYQDVSLDEVECAGVEHINFQRKKENLRD